jgi:ABC-type amino acid transport substrate-binding protein
MKSAMLALAAAAVAMFVGSASAQSLPDLGGRTIRAVTENAYTPLNFADPKTGQGIGWEYDAVNEIGKRLNAKIEWNLLAWDLMIQAVHDGQSAWTASRSPMSASSRSIFPTLTWTTRNTCSSALTRRGSSRRTISPPTPTC